MDARVMSMLVSQPDTLNDLLESVHATLLDRMPEIEHLACMLYEPNSGFLKTFLNSSCNDHPLSGYQFRLSDSQILSELAASAECRVIDNIDDDLRPMVKQSDGLPRQKYRSSFIVPMFNAEEFTGFIFFDASRTGVFTDQLQRDLLLCSRLIIMSIASEISLVRTLLVTVKLAKDFTSLHDCETGLHLDRMAHYSRMIASQLPESYQLNDEFVEHIYMFASLHDIGKIGVSDSILMKPGKLDPDERAAMELHVEKGVSILKQVLSNYQLADLRDSEMMLNIVAYHHEYLDGSGYPNGLAGDEIPLEARIITVADIFDALTSRRPYKKVWPVREAIEELKRMQHLNKLDADCVAVLEANTAELERIVVELADEPENNSKMALN
ncbi:HD-GYP domain-containing protein [Methylophaga sp. OBS4]|uniref:HD-GYP domain-containing protein n=1 Tax=Methylophaga sp. OBS4 TaxID=2991935 RepID=UPI00225AB20D|nr:HD domain-containing phosphohydrolase [Methylophaga sp. OBS4]MCX4186935.1 HD domain-containing protein [Methylophaga sp. OBS4]